MQTHRDTTTVSSTVLPDGQTALLNEAKDMVAGLFGRRETRLNFWDLVTGLLMELPRVNCWTIAEAVGHRSPYRLQHLLSRAVWDTEAVLATVAGWVAGQLAAHRGGPVVLITSTLPGVTRDRNPPTTPLVGLGRSPVSSDSGRQR
jgi:hypothetical protein